MKSKTKFEKSLLLSKITLFLSGIKDSSKRSVFLYKCLDGIFYLNLFWLYTDVFAEFAWLIEGILLGKSFSELTLTVPCTTICLLATAKSSPLYYNRDLLVIVFDKLRDMQPEQDNSKTLKDHNLDHEDNFTEINEETSGGKSKDNKHLIETNYEITEKKSKETENKIVQDAVKFLNIVILLLFTSSSIVVTAFSMMPLMSMAYDYYKDGETKLQLPFLVKYFFDPFTTTMWPIMYLHQVWSTVIVGANVFSADTSLYVFCTYIHMHFRILCHRLENVVFATKDDVRIRLMRLALMHQELIDLVNKVEVIYTKSTLFNILSSSLLICLSAFNVTFLDDMGATFAFLTFLVLCVSQTSLLCLFGDMLMRSSTKVSEAIYKSRWYDTDQSTKKSMLIILMRAQKPCKLTAAKFADLNLTAFTSILSRSWSYFALLKTMYK